MNKGRNVLITGATGEIGFAVVEHLVKEGYRLILCDVKNNKKRELKILRKRYPIELHEFDLRDNKMTSKALKYIGRQYRAFYALVNNAGIYPIKKINEYDLALWNEVISVNLTGAFLCVLYLRPYVSPGGRIVNIASTAAHLGSRDPGYSASKAGLVGLTKAIARNLSRFDIRVNAIAPGLIDTKMSQEMTKEDRKGLIQSALIKRAGRPSDVASVVSFLLSPGADFITGATLDVNGGIYLR
ncbi:SDR family oxidoreductase [Candidatus Roizmanbacteria bacterium]|nr:SDR family oxidoreductase [Candidatus Roizmanbacteria bacterium]